MNTPIPVIPIRLTPPNTTISVIMDNIPERISENPIIKAAQMKKSTTHTDDNAISAITTPIKTCHGGVLVESTCSAVPRYASSITVLPSFEIK